MSSPGCAPSTILSNVPKVDSIDAMALWRPGKRECNVAESWMSDDDIAPHHSASKGMVYMRKADKGMTACKSLRLWKFRASEADDWVRGNAAGDPITIGVED